MSIWLNIGIKIKPRTTDDIKPNMTANIDLVNKYILNSPIDIIILQKKVHINKNILNLQYLTKKDVNSSFFLILYYFLFHKY